MECWNMLSFEDKILIKTCGNLKYCLPEDSSWNTLTKIEKDKHWTIERTTGSRWPRSSQTVDRLSEFERQLR